MNAVQLMTGSGGWPLNVVALPDGRPVWGGTYFRKSQWISILNQLTELYDTDPDKLNTYARRLEQGIMSINQITPVKDKVLPALKLLKKPLKNGHRISMMNTAV